MLSYYRPARFCKHLHSAKIKNPVWHELGWVYKCIFYVHCCFVLFIVFTRCHSLSNVQYLQYSRFDDIGQSLNGQVLLPLLYVLRGTPSTETCCIRHKDTDDCFPCFYCEGHTRMDLMVTLYVFFFFFFFSPFYPKPNFFFFQIVLFFSKILIMFLGNCFRVLKIFF